MLLSEAWEKYQSDKKIEGYSPSHFENVRFSIQSFKAFFR